MQNPQDVPKPKESIVTSGCGAGSIAASVIYNNEIKKVKELRIEHQ